MRERQAGFTLIELVVVIVVSGVVMGFMAMFLAAPVHAYFAQERRTELTDSANNAMRMLESDVRKAVPGSVRIMPAGANLVMEMLIADDVARYRMGTNPPDLDIGAADTTFTTFGHLSSVAPGPYLDNLHLVIDNGGGGDAYTLSNVSTPPGTTITVLADTTNSGEQVITLAPAVTFVSDSPTRSVYFVRQPVSYICDIGAGTLTQFAGYTIVANPASHSTAGQLIADGASSAVVARDLSSCTFAATPGGAYFGGIVRLRMTFQRDGEVIEVFDQAQVENRR